MRSDARAEFTAAAGLLFGLLFFPTLQFSSRLFMQQGIFTFWIAQSLGITLYSSLHAPATTTPEIAPAPVRVRALAVMVDNHPDARPQSGVAEADTVWEALVEGGLTRDMLIFRSATASEIGPVRSARPYFLKWAAEADAVYTHVGGSDEALADLAKGIFSLDNVDEFRDGKTFWRDQKRTAPHNAYTSTDRLRTLIDAKDWARETDAVDASLRAPAPSGGAPASTISVTYAKNATSVEFRWNAATASYDLWRDKRLALDRDGKTISPPTVAVLEAQVVAIDDPHAKGLIGVANIGTGNAMVFRGGMSYQGVWKKSSAADPTRVYGEDGQQLPFEKGQVWYSVVGANRGGGVAFEP